MGVKERRERDRQSTRQRILDAARDLLISGGWDALTMRALAERIEYSPTAIYVHFADKDALLTELSVCDFQVFTERIAGSLPADATPLERLRFLGEAYVHFAVEHPTTYRHLFMTERVLSEEALARKPPDDAYATLLATIQACMEVGDLHRGWVPEHVAQSMWGALHGLVSLRMTMPKHMDLEFVPLPELARGAMHALVRGFQSPPEASG